MVHSDAQYEKSLLLDNSRRVNNGRSGNQSMPEEVIETNALVRCFGDVVAAKNAAFNVEKGELFGLLGPNGAGKTILLRLLTVQLEPTSGNCRVMGIDPARKSISVKKAIGVVPEVESPPSFLTGREYLQFIGLIRDINDIDKRVDYWIEFMDMTEMATVPCKDLSKGTRQKLMIATMNIGGEPFEDCGEVAREAQRERRPGQDIRNEPHPSGHEAGEGRDWLVREFVYTTLPCKICRQLHETERSQEGDHTSDQHRYDERGTGEPSRYACYHKNACPDDRTYADRSGFEQA